MTAARLARHFGPSTFQEESSLSNRHLFLVLLAAASLTACVGGYDVPEPVPTVAFVAPAGELEIARGESVEIRYFDDIPPGEALRDSRPFRSSAGSSQPTLRVRKRSLSSSRARRSRASTVPKGTRSRRAISVSLSPSNSRWKSADR